MRVECAELNLNKKSPVTGLSPGFFVSAQGSG